MFDRLRVICFDLDDTFWDVGSVLLRAESRVQGFLEQRYPRLAARHSRESFMAARLALARAEPGMAHDLTWLRTETMRLLALEAGCPEAVGREAFEVFIAARNEVQVFDDVRPALRRLARRYRLATFSNGNADLARIGLANEFVLSLNSEQVGFAKPHVNAYASVAARLGVATAEMAYVGDDPGNDIEGARAAGCRTVWVNRRAHRWPDTHAPADLEVAELGALAEFAERR